MSDKERRGPECICVLTRVQREKQKVLHQTAIVWLRWQRASGHSPGESREEQEARDDGSDVLSHSLTAREAEHTSKRRVLPCADPTVHGPPTLAEPSSASDLQAPGKGRLKDVQKAAPGRLTP